MKFLSMDVFTTFDQGWALVTSGQMEDFNTMTVSWGGCGTLWGKPVATVYVKPIRYTHEYLEKNEYFTVSFLPLEYREDLFTLGTESGRDGDKVAKTGLTPVAVGENGESVGFKQASVTLLCKKIYKQELDVSAMPTDVVDQFYLNEDAHTMYVGEVVDILGEITEEIIL